MSKLCSLLREFRNQLGESEGVGTAAKTAYNEWKTCLGHIESLVEHTEKAASEAEAAAKEMEDNMPERARQHVIGLHSKTQAVEAAAKTVYVPFKIGRENFYMVAKAWGIPTTTKGAGVKAKPIGDVDERTLVQHLQSGAARLKGAVHKTLELGATAKKGMQKAWIAADKSTEIEQKRKQEIIDSGRLFRDAVSESLFARVNGVMRRTSEIAKRVAEETKYEGSVAIWQCPFDVDQEFGGNEISDWAPKAKGARVESRSVRSALLSETTELQKKMSRLMREFR